MFCHHCQGIQLVPQTPSQQTFRNEMHKPQERSSPRLDRIESTAWPQNTVDLVQHRVKVVRQNRQMMQPALYDHQIAGLVFERQTTTIGHVTLCGTIVLKQEFFREINTLDPLKTQLMQGLQAIASTTKDLNNLSVFWPRRSSERIEPSDKLTNFFLGSFESSISGFPF